MSEHLKAIIDKSNQIANLQVVFLDIEKYSQRRTTDQVTVINAFTKCVKKTLTEIGKDFIDFTQKNNLNFSTDIICLPTGDGATVCFTFEGLHNIHVKFAEQFLKNEYSHNSTAFCDKFQSNGWCNCHNKFNTRIGISEGKGVIYKDINDNYNIAGTPVNMAARLLGEANSNQILLTESAYKQIVDLEDNPDYSDEFIEIPKVKIKHGLEINIYLLTSDEEYINSEIAEKHLKNAKMRDIGERMKEITSQPIDFDSPEELADSVAQTFSILGDLMKTITEPNDSNKLEEKITPSITIPIVHKKTRRKS